jgi:transmembrane sensor
MAMKMNSDIAVRYITGKADAKEIEEFEMWLVESSDNFQQFEEFKESWKLADKAYQNFTPDIAKAWEVIRMETISKVQKRNRGRNLVFNLLKIAASVLFIIALGFLTKLVYNWSQQEEWTTYTSYNTITLIALSDKSKVWLNKNSEIIVPKVFKGNSRKVHLKGEAYFEVVKNPKKPFMVYAHRTTTKVLGTSFNLNARLKDSSISLLVVTGKVLFALNKNREIILTPGQNGIINLAKSSISKEKINNNNCIAWKTGILQFKNASLDELCMTLSDYYRVKIDPAMLKGKQGYSFTGSFENKPLLEVLNIIEITLGIKFNRTGDELTVQ